MRDYLGFIIIAVLVLALLGSLVWGFGRNRIIHTLKEENQQVQQSLDAMTDIRDRLVGEVNDLTISYSNLVTDNEELQGSLSESEADLTNAQRALSAARKKVAQVDELHQQIQELLATRSRLEASMAALRSENDSLRRTTTQLVSNLQQSKTENNALSQLNSTIQEELERLTLENFKASAFEVGVQQRSEKVTAKSNKARKIILNYDLTNVPEEYRGVRPLYLVITDVTGRPISGDQVQKATISVNNQTTGILPAETKLVNIGANQRLNFTHDLADRLKPGYYRVSVFTDIGLLGAASFKLR